MLFVSGTHSSVGIDYLRVTWAHPQRGVNGGYPNGSPQDVFDHNARVLRLAVARWYEGLPNWDYRRLLGYAGDYYEGAFCGTREDGGMLQASGGLADELRGSSLLWDNCTRIDLQITIWGANGGGRLVSAIYSHLLGTQAGQTAKRKLTYITSGDDGDTVYIGSRSSELFFRIYDKGLQSGDDEYAGAVRFEVELKSKAAGYLWELMSDNRSHEIAKAYVATLFLRVGLAFNGCDVDFATVAQKKRQPPNVQSKMRWLALQVAPSIEKLLAQGVELSAILEALGVERRGKGVR